MTSAAQDTIWVSVSSHRARAKMRSALGGILPASHGVWPTKVVDGVKTTTGWARGEYYEVPSTHRASLSGIKGITVLTGPPRGDLFRRVTGL